MYPPPHDCTVGRVIFFNLSEGDCTVGRVIFLNLYDLILSTTFWCTSTKTFTGKIKKIVCYFAWSTAPVRCPNINNILPIITIHKNNNMYPPPHKHRPWTRCFLPARKKSTVSWPSRCV